MRVLYDLVGAQPERRFSPYCWRIKMALAHKGLAYETVPVRFSDKELVAFSGQGLVPVLRDGPVTVHDSLAIARYLDGSYPDAPSLFGGPGAQASAVFLARWAELTLGARVARLCLNDIYDAIDPADRAYFRQSREARFGIKIEDAPQGREAGVEAFRDSLAPLRATLREQAFLGGAAHNFADYIVFGAFMMARSVSRVELLSADDPVFAWRDRLLDAFGGLARAAPGYDSLAA